MIIGIHGKKQHGKDTVASIIQYLTSPLKTENTPFEEFRKDFGNKRGFDSHWKRKIFAGKLKEIVCLLIGCTMEQLEDNEFKETPLGEEWTRYAYADGHNDHYRNEEWSKSMHSVFCSKERYEEEVRINWQTAYKSELTPRLLLQLLGTECGRNIIHPNLWVNATMADYKSNHPGEFDEIFNKTLYPPDSFPKWLITDVRFPNEAEAIQKREGSILLKVERPGITGTDQHESETALDNFTNWDYCIINDGSLEHLIEKVKAFLVEFKII